MLYFYLAVGGVVGTLARYGVTSWVQSAAGMAFPWGTLTVNLTGSFALGVAVQAAEVSSLSPEMRSLIAVGFCGAFTTFSTFSLESLGLMQRGEWVRAALYAFGSLGLGVICLLAGAFLAGQILKPSA